MRKAAILLILLGVILRLTEYISNPSLTLDEARIALWNESISLHDSFFLKDTLPEYRQCYSIGFLAALKLSKSLFGSNEFSLRLFVLMASLVALILFYRVARFFLSEPWSLLALGLFCISRDIVYMSIHLKPVAFDILVVLIFVWQIFPAAGSGLSWKQAAALGLLSAVLVFCSIPGILFMLTVSGILIIIRILEKELSQALKVSVIFLSIAMTAGLYYALSLQYLRIDAELMSFWSSSFMPAHEGPISMFQWLYVALMRLFSKFLQYPVSLSAFLFFLGIIFAWHYQRRHLVFLAAPIVATWVAAAFRFYPFDGRTIFFLMPFFIIMTVYGAQHLAASFPMKRSMSLLLIVFMLFLPARSSAQQFLEYNGPEEIKGALYYVKHQRNQGDKVLVYQGSSYAYRYYSSSFNIGSPQAYVTKDSIDSVLENLAVETGGAHRVWIVFTHVKFDERQNERLFILDKMRRHGRMIDGLEIKVRPQSVVSTLENQISSSVYLFKMSL